MGGEEHRLFGVGAKAGIDDQSEPGMGRGGGHPVEGDSDIRPHPLPGPIDERATVAAPTGHCRHRTCGAAGRGGCFGYRRRLDVGTTALAAASPQSEAAGHDSLDADRCERSDVGKGDLQPRGADVVRSRHVGRGGPGPSQVLELLHVRWIRQTVGKHGRRQQPRQVVAHRARRRDRGQVGTSLRSPLSRHRTGDRDQRQGSGDQREGAPERQQQDLAVLSAGFHAPTLAGADARVVRSNENLCDRTDTQLRP